jgi:ectoine hydroxylase-related dioxygenase (phytanoyl-CoA dioxygenase family)
MIFREVKPSMEVSVSMDVDGNIVEQQEETSGETSSSSSSSLPLPFVPLVMKRGSLVVFKGSLEHYSLENTSPKSRHTFQVCIYIYI